MRAQEVGEKVISRTPVKKRVQANAYAVVGGQAAVAASQARRDPLRLRVPAQKADDEPIGGKQYSSFGEKGSGLAAFRFELDEIAH